MIKVHKLNGTEVVVNADLIEHLEIGKETVISLATGNRMLVRESADDVVVLVIEYKKKVYAEAKVINPIQGFNRE